MKRERILRAAERLFGRHGPQRVTVAEIAAEAGVSKGLPYVHYRSKEELLGAVVLRVIHQWREHVAAAAEASVSVTGALTAMHLASLDFAGRHPLLQRLFEDTSRSLHSQFAQAAVEARDEWLRELEELIATGIASGELARCPDARLAAHTYYLLHLSFFQQLDQAGANNTPLPFDPTAEPIRTGAIELLLRGLRSEDDHS